MNLMERFADVQMMQELTLGEKLACAGITTIMGMGLTFCVLIFLWGSVALMARLSSEDSRNEQVPSQNTPKSQAVPVHVIAAAAAAMEVSPLAAELSIRRIKRMKPRPAWTGVITERKACR